MVSSSFASRSLSWGSEARRCHGGLLAAQFGLNGEQVQRVGCGSARVGAIDRGDDAGVVGEFVAGLGLEDEEKWVGFCKRECGIDVA